MEIVKTNEIVVEEESSVLDAPCEPSCFSSIDDDEQNEDESVICNGQKDSNMKEVTLNKGYMYGACDHLF